MKFRSLLIKFLIILFSSGAYGGDPKNDTRERIQAEARQFLNAELEQRMNTANFSRYEIEVGNIDPRLNLPLCETESISYTLLSDPTKTSRNTLKASCLDQWNIILNARIELFQQVVMANDTIGRGFFMSSDQLKIGEAAVSELRYGFFRSVEELNNMVAKRHIAPDDIITPFNVEGAQLVQRGDNVVILAASDILTVKMSGTAMSDGRLGQQIVVKNLSSNRMIKAFVKDRGMVEVPL
jgi:flagella basal body P-ring formation protein FlgA